MGLALMPCWSSIRMSVDFKASSITLLKAALEAEGFAVSLNGESALTFRHEGTGIGGSWRNGTLTADQGFDVNALRTSYSKAAVKEAARRCGWNYTAAGKQRAKIERRY